MMLPKVTLALVALLPLLCGCSGFGAINMGGIGSIGGSNEAEADPATGAPTTLVETTELPPLVGAAEGADPFKTAAAPNAQGTPPLYPDIAPGGAPLYPDLPPAGQQTYPVTPGGPTTDLALLPPATPVQVTRETLLGGWTITTGTETCQLFLTLTSWTGGYRASTPNCASPSLQTIAAWDLNGQQIVLSGPEGVPVARLTSSGPTRFDGQTEGAATPISFFR